MPLTPYTNTTEIIRALDDEPNDVGGLTADQLKAKFDQFGEEFVDYFNNKHLPEVDTHLAENVTDVGGVHGLEVEEGDWTPIIVGSTYAGQNTYSLQQGRYIKIGKLITVFCQVALSAKDALMSGRATIRGLPFIIYGQYAGASLGNYRYISLGNSNEITARFDADGNEIRLFENGDTVGSVALSATKINDNTYLCVGGSYHIV